MGIIAILAALGIAYVVKQQLVKRKAICSDLTAKQLNLLIGLPILLMLYAVWTFVKSIGSKKGVENLLFGNYMQWMSETDYKWNAELISQALSNCSQDDMALYAVYSLYENFNILSVILVGLCGTLNIVKLFDVNKFPKFSLNILFAIEMIVSLIVCLFNIFRLHIGIPVLANRMDMAMDMANEYANKILYVNLAGSVLVIVLVFVLWGQYKKAVTAYMAVNSHHQSKDDTATL